MSDIRKLTFFNRQNRHHIMPYSVTHMKLCLESCLLKGERTKCQKLAHLVAAQTLHQPETLGLTCLLDFAEAALLAIPAATLLAEAAKLLLAAL